MDKSTSEDKSQAVTVDGKKVTFPINSDDLELGKDFGIIVKEPHKFRSCAMSQPVITAPEKVAVRDPHKLTDEDKKAIDKAIRDANTKNGKSKLPDGTGTEVGGTPAIIEFDKDGNVTIISPNDVVVSGYDSEYNPIFAKNPDGTYQLNPEAKVTKFPAKDLVKNIAPKSPEIAVDINTGKVTITPPAYVNPGDDTDLASYKVSYKNADGEDKTVTIKRTVDGTGKSTWSSEDGATVDENTGVVTLEIKDLAVGDTITAIAKDKGGLADDDTNPLESDPASTQLETVEVSYDSNGGSGNMDSRRLNKGQKYTILENKFTAPKNQKFDTWEIDSEHIKAGTEITVNKNTIIKALWKLSVNKNIEVPNPVEVRDPRKLTDEDKEKIDKAIRDVNTKNGVSNLPDGIGNHAGVPAFIEFDKDGNVRIISPNNVNTQSVDGKTVYQKKSDGSYDVIDESQVINIPAKDIIKNIKPRSPKIAVDTGTGKVTITPPAYVNPGDDTDIASYKVSYKNADGENKTTTIKRTVDGNGKSTWSSEDGATVDENTGVVTLEIKDLAVGDTITAIAKDKGGLADDDTDPLYSDPVTATLETVEVVYDANGGTGNMEVKKLNKLNNGLMYKLLDNEFTAPNGQEFDKWEIDGQKFDPGTEIKVNSNIVVKATWKALPNPPKNTDKVHIVAPQTGDVSILALCSPAILASVGMVALFRKRKEKR